MEIQRHRKKLQPANTGAEDNSGVSEEEVKGLIAKAMKDFAASLMATEE